MDNKFLVGSIYLGVALLLVGLILADPHNIDFYTIFMLAITGFGYSIVVTVISADSTKFTRKQFGRIVFHFHATMIFMSICIVSWLNCISFFKNVIDSNLIALAGFLIALYSTSFYVFTKWKKYAKKHVVYGNRTPLD